MLALAREHPLAKASVSIEEIADYPVVPLEELFPTEMAETYIPRKTPAGRVIARLRVPYGEMARRDPSSVAIVQPGSTLRRAIGPCSAAPRPATLKETRPGGDW